MAIEASVVYIEPSNISLKMQKAFCKQALKQRGINAKFVKCKSKKTNKTIGKMIEHNHANL